MWGILKFIAAPLLVTTLVVSEITLTTTPYTTTEFTTTTPSELIPGKNSCNGFCNQAIEYCSCEASCSLNNNCCLDFCSYCYEVNAGFCDSTTDNGIAGFNICMGQCGRTSGPCSCDPSCVESGNCCPTFCDFCSYMDTGYCQVPTSVTDPGSCNGLCYGSTGSCSCDSSCVDNSNCCPDFCFYCQSLNYGFCQFAITATTEFTITTTVPTIGYTSQGGGDSCNGLCSSFAANCSCEYSCFNNGNCCPDFCDFCSYVNFGYCEQSTEEPIISSVPITPGSCKGFCSGWAGTCSCAASCIENNNCCPDFCDYCSNDYYNNYEYCNPQIVNQTEIMMSTSTLPTIGYTAQGGGDSCNGLCSSFAANCSCEYYCVNNGNCCPDFCDFCSYVNFGYCEQSTEEPIISTVPTIGYTAQGGGDSCNGLCSSFASNCSCEYSCGYNNNCCPDFCDFCPYVNFGYCEQSTAMPNTTSDVPVEGSCNGICTGWAGNCSCDYYCTYNNSCCPDFCDYCTYVNSGYCEVSTTTYTSLTVPTIGYTAQGGGDSCNGLCSSFASNCSCEYSCGYNNNCCPDFCDFCPYVNFGYCEQSPVIPSATADVPVEGSCNGICTGWAGNCSCDYYCTYNNSCCPDFCDYCTYVNSGYCEASTTTYTALSESFGPFCGGVLIGPSGETIMPQYTETNGNSAQCTWYIEVARGYRIQIQIAPYSEVNFYPCNMDVISVIDGPSGIFPIIGLNCFGEYGTYESSSNFLTVTSNLSSVNTNSAFLINYRTVPVFSDSDITCSSYFMTVKLHQPYIWSLGYNASDLHLDDAACTPQIFGSIILFKFPLNECGTNRKAVNGTIIYSNNVRSSPSNGLITRETYLRLNVQCKMEQEAITDIMYQANGGITANETGTGTYNISMVFYHGDFTSPVLENPYIVDLNEDIFVQIMLYTSDYLEVFIDTCTASPSQFGYPSYDLIRDGCVRDDTFVAFPSTSFDIARFRFNAFKFVDYSSSVYLECKVVLCQMYDYSSRCNRGCQARRRRDLSSSKDKVDVVSGRIELRKYKNFAEENIKLKKEEVSKISSTQTLVWISMTALATTTAILAFFTLKFYKKTTKDEWRL